MPSYTLHYFPARGAGETIRQLFHLSGTAYTDHRITMEEWSAIKQTMPFNQLPVLEIDGKFLPQSFAIYRYLAKQFGYAGKTDFEEAWVADQFKDYINEIRSYIIVVYGFAEGDKEKMCKEIGEPARDKYFGMLEKTVKENGTGYMVGDSVTWIDLFLADHMDLLDKHLPGFYDEFPWMITLKNKVRSDPKLRDWLEKRPNTAM